MPYPLRDASEFYVLCSSFARADRLPLTDFPRLWNSTDHLITSITLKSSFKYKGEYELLEKYRNFRCVKVCTVCVMY